jgi:hypothetical protein
MGISIAASVRQQAHLRHEAQPEEHHSRNAAAEIRDRDAAVTHVTAGKSQGFGAFRI